MSGSVLSLSDAFFKTLRDDPADAEVPSHRLLVRAGFVRRISPGVFAWLPLGWRVVRRVEAIVREEMEAAGAEEVNLPALLPRQPYERSGRWTDYGDDLFRLQDRRGADHLLGPTHEEIFTLLVADMVDSYRSLPRTLFQIQTKFRDELRPRAGVLRGREFLMKDAYSFDLDDHGLARSYEQQRVAYERIFDRLGLDCVRVSAMSGAMGGSASEEFLAPCDAGEDTFVRCIQCGYAANVEAVLTPAPTPEPAHALPDADVLDTPDTPTIESLIELLNREPRLRRADREWTAADTLKNLLVTVIGADGSREPLAIGVPGDRDVDPKRLGAALAPATAEPFTDDDFAAHPALVKGYIGPGALGVDGASGIRYLLDPRVADGTVWVTGANQDGTHMTVVAGRDFAADGTIDVAEVRDGDDCPRCGSGLALARGIEIGHIFQLGRRYAEALELRVLDDRGEQVTPTMGSYGIGITRAVAAIAEQHHDELGLCWPSSVAPADVHVVVAGKGDEHVDAARRMCSDLADRGVHLILDDRVDASAGVKFKDAELLGVPTIVVVGRGLADGVVEVRWRATGEQVDTPVDTVVDRLSAT